MALPDKGLFSAIAGKKSLSGFHCASICQTITKRCGGSHRVMVATLVCVPSSDISSQRPPSRGSIRTFAIGFLPTPWSSGHQRERPLVKTSKAHAAGAFTRTDLRTGAMMMGAFIQQLLYVF